jgi:hypothetical protein
MRVYQLNIDKNYSAPVKMLALYTCTVKKDHQLLEHHCYEQH